MIARTNGKFFHRVMEYNELTNRRKETLILTRTYLASAVYQASFSSAVLKISKQRDLLFGSRKKNFLSNLAVYFSYLKETTKLVVGQPITNELS